MAELRLAGIVDRDGADAFLPGFVERYSERFAVPALDPEPDWLPVPAAIDLARVSVLKYRRKVAKNHTVRLDGRVLRSPRARFAYSRRMVELHLRLDGSMVAYDGERCLAVTEALPGPGAAARPARPPIGPRADSHHRLRCPGHRRPITLGVVSERGARLHASD